MESLNDYQKKMLDFWSEKYERFKGDERHVVGRLDAPLKEYLEGTQIIKDRFSAIMEPGDTVIDYGCGIGRFADFLGTYFENYIGVDLVKKLPAGKKFFQVDKFLGVEVKADAIFTSVVLQHITDDNYVIMLLNKFATCLSEKGVIYMQEQVGDGSLVVRRGFPYIKRRKREWFITNLGALGFVIDAEIPMQGHRIFKFKRVESNATKKQ